MNITSTEVILRKYKKKTFQRYFIDIKVWRLHLLVHVSFYRVYIKSLTKNKDLLNW